MKNLSEEALEAIVGAIPAGVVVIEKSNGKIIYANERAIDLYGVDLCGLEMAQHSTKIMRTLTLKGDVYPPEQFPVSKALLRGKEAKDELIIERPDGSCIIVSASAKPIKDKNGQVVAAVGFFEEITERKNAEKTLKRKQQELTLILDSDPTIIFYKDRQGKVIQANKAFGEALKVPKEVLLGKTVFDIYSPIIAQAMTNDDAEVLKSGQPKLGIIEPYEAPTGLRWIRTDKVPTFDEDGIVNGLVGFSEDVTEQMQAELELKERYTLLESISQNIDAGLAIIDKDYRVIWANDILRRIGACPGGLCYKNIAHAETVCLDCGVKKIFNENVPLDVHEYRTVNQKGETVWIELRVTPLKDACGNVKSALELAVPITERKKAEERELENAMQLKNAERLAAIGTTAGMVGHDIRNPLQAMLSDVYLLKTDLVAMSQCGINEGVFESLEGIEKNICYVNKIVADLQDYARPLNPEHVSIDLSELIGAS